MSKYAFNTPEHLDAVEHEDRDDTSFYKHRPDLGPTKAKVTPPGSDKLHRLLLHAKQSQQGR